MGSPPGPRHWQKQIAQLMALSHLATDGLPALSEASRNTRGARRHRRGQDRRRQTGFAADYARRCCWPLTARSRRCRSDRKDTASFCQGMALVGVVDFTGPTKKLPASIRCSDDARERAGRLRRSRSSATSASTASRSRTDGVGGKPSEVAAPARRTHQRILSPVPSYVEIRASIARRPPANATGPPWTRDGPALAITGDSELCRRLSA